MKRIGVKVTALAAALCLFSCLLTGVAAAQTRIGILVWSPEPRYIEAKKGVLEVLEKAGYAEPKAQIVTENGNASKETTVGLAKQFAKSKLDVIVPIGTSAAVIVAQETTTTPIVFSMVYDPVEAKIAADWKSSGRNTTGSSPRVPMEQIFAILLKITPIKKIGILFTPGEKNSEIQLKEVQEGAAARKIESVAIPVATPEDGSREVEKVASQVDALYLTGSSIVGKSVGAVLDIATRRKILTCTHLEDLVARGVLVGVTADPYEVGRLAGEKAVQVLKGTAPAAIPIEQLKQVRLLINGKTVKAGNFAIPAEILATAKVLE